MKVCLFSKFAIGVAWKFSRLATDMMPSHRISSRLIVHLMCFTQVPAIVGLNSSPQLLLYCLTSAQWDSRGNDPSGPQSANELVQSCRHSHMIKLDCRPEHKSPHELPYACLHAPYLHHLPLPVPVIFNSLVIHPLPRRDMV